MELGHRLHLSEVIVKRCSWTVLEDQVGLLVLGLALSVVVSMLSVALPAVKGKITGKLFRKTYKSTLLLKEKGSVMS